MSLSLSDLKHLSKLANLEVSEDRLKAIEPQLNEILEFVGQLQKVDVSGVEETVEITGLKNVNESDQSRESLEQDVVLDQTPVNHSGYVLVPAVFEEGSNA